MRHSVEDQNSNTDSKIIYDYFDVTLKYQCDDDILSLTGPTDIAMREYQLGSGSVNYAANVAQTISGCLIEETHEIYDDNLQSWVAMTQSAYTWLVADPVDGAFDVNQAVSSTYVPFKDFRIKIVYTSKYSQKSASEQSVTDEFFLRIGHVCEHDTLTKNAEFADWTYIIWSTQVLEMRQPSYTQLNSKEGVCTLTAKLYLWNEGTQVWDDWASNWSGYTSNNNFVTTSVNSPSPTAAQLTIHYTDPTVTTNPSGTSLKPFKDYNFKITLEDENADNTCSSTIYQQQQQPCTLN